MDEGLCLDIRSLRKRFGAHPAVDNVDLSIRKGEFFALLGSSGCGKTTLLRMVAGFETPDSGEIRLQGRDVARVPPNERPVNMVFQNYALFPHLTVRDNAAFGLRMRRLPEAEVASRVEEALASVQMAELAGRKPHQLSGGQQQRVALARALVNRPEILLLDEPMAALDEKLRKDMRGELKALQHRIGVSFLYVTHDQEEALSLADRIAVMEKGGIAQVGTPQEVYESPASTFVADFVGHSNLWGGKVVEVETLLTDQDPSVRRPGGPHEPPGRREGEPTRRRAFVEVPEVGRVAVCVTNGFVPGSEVVLALRPERIHLSTSPVENLDNRLPGKVERILFLGSDVHYQVRLSNGRKLMAHTVYSPLRRARKEGDRVYLQWRAEDVNVLHP